MLRQTFAAGIFVFGLAHDPGGCGSTVDSAPSTVNAPCTRDKDCEPGLTCEKGVCTSPPRDGGGDASDGGPADGGVTDAAGGG